MRARAAGAGPALPPFTAGLSPAIRASMLRRPMTKTNPAMTRECALHANASSGHLTWTYLYGKKLSAGCASSIFCLRSPNDNLLMQWNCRHILLQDLDRLTDHCISLRLIRFDTDLLDQQVERGVGVAAGVHLTPLAVARSQQRIERVVGIIRRRRPTQQVEIGVVVRREYFVEVFRFRLRVQIDLDPDTR